MKTASLHLPQIAIHGIPLPPPDPRLVRHLPGAVRKRSRIWELSENLHCSVIGTCLSTRELRQAMNRLGFEGRDLTDHELHTEAVRTAGCHNAAGKIISKVLDQRHRVAIRRFEAAETEEALTALWRSSVQQGDIPGAYWALLTHPGVTHALIRLAFGEVHMLSHLVGAANRADIKRLCTLEEEVSALSAKLQRQQVQLRDAIVSRDATIQGLQAALSTRIAETSGQGTAVSDDERMGALESCVAALERRLTAETRRREAAERGLQEAREALRRDRDAKRQAEETAAQLTAEIAAFEASFGEGPDDDAPEPARLDGITVLYVGGRTHHVHRLRALTEGLGADFLHHDGGVEETTATLAGLVMRADLVLFPVDCVSHDAALLVKRLCRHQGKPFRPLRSSGASSLLAALAEPNPAMAAQEAVG
jgi:hypothetical protein